MDDKEKIVLQVGVKALLKNSEGKYLLIKRSTKKYPEVKGRWEIPGGRIEPGTTLEENLRREVKEETNLEITGTLKLVAAQDILRISGRHIVRLTYTADARGEVKIDPEEVDEFKWAKAEEIEIQEDMDVYLRKVIAGNIIL